MPRKANVYMWNNSAGVGATSPSPRTRASRPSGVMAWSISASAARRWSRTHPARRRPDSVSSSTISRRLSSARSRVSSPATSIRSHSLLVADAEAPTWVASRLRLRLPARSMISSARSWAGGTEEPIFSTARSATSIRAASPRSAVLTSSCSSLKPRNMSYPIRITHRASTPAPACDTGGEPISADIASCRPRVLTPLAAAAVPAGRGSRKPLGVGTGLADVHLLRGQEVAVSGGHHHRPSRPSCSLCRVRWESLGAGTTRGPVSYTTPGPLRATLADGKCFSIQCCVVEKSRAPAPFPSAAADPPAVSPEFAEQVQALQAATRVLTGVALHSLDVLDGVITLPQFRMLAVLAELGRTRSARVARAPRLDLPSL